MFRSCLLVLVFSGATWMFGGGLIYSVLGVGALAGKGVLLYGMLVAIAPETNCMTQHTHWETASPVNPKKGFRIHLLVFLLATPVIWLVWYVTGSRYPWPVWSTPAWAVGVLFHYLGVFVFKKSVKNQ